MKEKMMKRADFVRIIGAEEATEYAPVAGMLQSGYGFAGYFNSRLNEKMEEACVLMNVRLVDLRSTDERSARPQIADFNDFVQEIVRESYEGEEGPEEPRTGASDIHGTSLRICVTMLASCLRGFGN